MRAMRFQITSLTIVYSTVYWGANQRKRQSSTSLVFVRGIHRWPVNSPHKVPVTQKMFPFDDVIMSLRPRPNGRRLADHILKHILFNENIWIAIKISLKFVRMSPIGNALVEIMTWRQIGIIKLLSESLVAWFTDAYIYIHIYIYISLGRNGLNVYCELCKTQSRLNRLNFFWKKYIVDFY